MKEMTKNFLSESKFHSLGTDVFVRIVACEEDEKNRARNDFKKVKKIFLFEEKIFSRFDPKSELCRLNKNIGVWQEASPDLVCLAGRALRYNKISGGLYDPRIIEILERIGYGKNFKEKSFSKTEAPPEFSAATTELGDDLKISENKIFFARRMDFSGIAKGYIVDRAADFLKSRGWKNFLVDAGGDMFAGGKKWRIAVEGVPEEKLMLEISDSGIAMSGISRKKWTIGGKKVHHLVNPKNPNKFSRELRTVAVIAENAENADGRAKTLVLMGKRKGLQFAEGKNIAAIFLDYRGCVFLSSAAEKYISGKISI